MNTELLNRAIENAGPMGEAQRRAMWAKRGNPAGAARAAPAQRAPVTPLPVRGRPVNAGILPGEWDPIRGGPAADGRPAAPGKPIPGRPIPTKPIDTIRPPPAGRPTNQQADYYYSGRFDDRTGRYTMPDGRSMTPEEMQRARDTLARTGRQPSPGVDQTPLDPHRQPANPIYIGGSPNFDERTGRYVNPQDPRGQPGLRYPGGSPNFDERTGRYITPPAVPQPGQPWRPSASPDTPATPRITIDGGGVAVPRGQGRELDPNVRQAIVGLQNMLDRLRGFST